LIKGKGISNIEQGISNDEVEGERDKGKKNIEYSFDYAQDKLT
jgi:hypothetical protein